MEQVGYAPTPLDLRLLRESNSHTVIARLVTLKGFPPYIAPIGSKHSHPLFTVSDSVFSPALLLS